MVHDSSGALMSGHTEGSPVGTATPSGRDRFLANWGPGLFLGVSFGDWIALLRRNRFAVDRPYWFRAAFVTLHSLGVSLLRRRETRRFGPKVRDVRIESPLFILGHWRSGTTHLHNLLAVDSRFAFPNFYQVLHPHTFLTTEAVASKLFSPFLSNTRAMDNVRQTLQVPQEDELALCVATLCSPYLGMAFPRHHEFFDPYLTFRGVDEDVIARWKATYVGFLKKLTYKYGRPLLLKSPAHTCRIRLLLDLFPDARFLHIHRNPYTVFQSTRHLLLTLAPLLFCQRPVLTGLTARILDLYREMYDVFFEERSLIPKERFHEISFDELERAPMAEMRAIYDKLQLPDFEVVEPALQRYVNSLAGYEKNVYSPLPLELRREIARAWHRSFEKWGYSPVIDGA